MKALQSISLLPGGRALAVVRGHVHRFDSVEALADWLHPEPETEADEELATAHRWCAWSNLNELKGDVLTV